ncbi:MAG: hypothetical protein K9M98_09605 [Cephaloticoccus sp.]|nr:hypothetical protein [Cephaloticoccus sp.]MCF7760748.1 hypothetical protein [Cephaloticoccus sp.]
MTIKLHLDRAEYDPIERTAKAMGCDVEDVLYAAMDAYMCRLGNLDGFCGPECKRTFRDHDAMRDHVHNTKTGRKANLPIWADTAGGAHNYESFDPEHSHKTKGSAF